MNLHPGTEPLPEVSRAELDSIRRALQENEDWYQDLVEHSRDLLCIHDLGGRLLSVNPAPARTLGYSVEELLQIPMREVVAPEYRSQFDAYLVEIERTGEARGFLVVMTRSGERRIWQYYNTLRTEGVASPIVRGIAHDVTEQKRTAKLLREASELNRQIIASTSEGVVVYDRNLRCLAWNPFMEKLTGIPASAALGKPYQELVPPAVKGHDLEGALNRALQGETITLPDEKLPDAGENQRWISNRKSPLRDAKGEIAGVVATLHDVTERVQLENMLGQSEADLNRAQTVAHIGSWRFDIPSHSVTLSDESYRIVGLPIGSPLTPENAMGVTHPDDGTRVREAWTAALAQGHYDIENRILVQGGVRWVRTKAEIEYDDEGRPRLAVGTVQDVTESKRAAALLEASETRYRAIHDRSPVGICWIESGSGRFLGVNPKYCEIVGRTEQDLLGRDFQSITHPDDLAENCEKLRQLVNGGARHFGIQKRYVRPDGSARWAEVEVAAMGPASERPHWHMAIVQDITERKHAQERLREYERVVEGLEEMIVVIDREYCYVIANRAFLQYRGMENEQVVGHRIEELLSKEVFDALVKEKLDECFRGKVVTYEMKYTYPKLGERELLISYFPIEGPTGVDRIACVLQDITERKRSEQAVRDAKEFSESLIRTANVIILGLDTQGNITLFNQAAEEITGYTFSELKGKNWSTLVPRDRFPWVWEEFDRLMGGAAAQTFENPILTKTGEERYISWRNNQVKVNGAVVATISFGNDITERRRAEKALRRSEENYRMFISQSSEGIFRQDLDAPVAIDLPEDDLIRHILHDSYLAECNEAIVKMYGLSSVQEFVGKRLTEMLPPEDPHNIELTRDYIRSGFRILDRESHEFDIHGNPKVFLNSLIGIVASGMLVRTWGIQRDVTEKVKLEESRRNAEEALRQNVTQLQQVTEELRLAQEKLSEEKLYLEQAIDNELGFGEIIGRSIALKEVMDKVARVAPSDASVLLLGETGTGKELVARAIHSMSKRKDNSFIKVNCAAIPSGLLESELFGHEKGAFTGAVAKKLGRVELADHGTLFLDEIGEIPLELQPKLLRVLQDQEFERLGGTQTLKVNFRLVAATNRDLLHSVNQREFRSDLYYRLNVFPVRTPPLRERREDIPLLIEHFVRKYAARMGKSTPRTPAKTMEALVQWGWPGNIRELENFVERSVILTPGLVLQVPLSELMAPVDESNIDTLKERERERILRVLRECRGQLGGPNGAAARLGLKRTTLQSKLTHFGINPGSYRA